MDTTGTPTGRQVADRLNGIIEPLGKVAFWEHTGDGCAAIVIEDDKFAYRGDRGAFRMVTAELSSVVPAKKSLGARRGKRVVMLARHLFAMIVIASAAVSCGGDDSAQRIAELEAELAAAISPTSSVPAEQAGSTSTQTEPASTRPATTTTEVPTTTTTTEPTTNKAAVQVTASDIAIDYIVLDESCFGSAGSLMEIDMSPALAPGSSLSLDDFGALQLLVTFDITNTEDGVTRGSFEIDRGMFAANTDRLSFERCNTLPNIVVTSVNER
jgi:hypothetical protein